MASTRPNPASPSDGTEDLEIPVPEIPIGVRVERQRALGPAGQPGTIRVYAYEGGEVHELEGVAAVAALPGLMGTPKKSAWVDLIAPTPKQALEVGTALGLHPLVVEDVLEGNQRAKIETTDGR
jgi:Mg2+ and Co2+ transporter CorA